MAEEPHREEGGREERIQPKVRGVVSAGIIHILKAAAGIGPRNYAERANLPFAGYIDLASRDEVYNIIAECVDKVNADLSEDSMMGASQIHRFLILHKELDADDGELTRTNKVRRGFIADRFGPLITALYDGTTEQHISTEVTFEDGRKGAVAGDVKIRDAKVLPVRQEKAA